MGILLDTTVFVEMERTGDSKSASAALGAPEQLEAALGSSEATGIAAITASELLHGVHRASNQHRARREAFVESVLNAFPVLPFDLLTARIHARLWAHLAATGTEVGAHDRIIAATALAAGWQVATANERHFQEIPGLNVTAVALH